MPTNRLRGDSLNQLWLRTEKSSPVASSARPHSEKRWIFRQIFEADDLTERQSKQPRNLVWSQALSRRVFFDIFFSLLRPAWTWRFTAVLEQSTGDFLFCAHKIKARRNEKWFRRRRTDFMRLWDRRQRLSIWRGAWLCSLHLPRWHFARSRMSGSSERFWIDFSGLPAPNRFGPPWNLHFSNSNSAITSKIQQNFPHFVSQLGSSPHQKTRLRCLCVFALFNSSNRRRKKTRIEVDFFSFLLLSASNYKIIADRWAYFCFRLTLERFRHLKNIKFHLGLAPCRVSRFKK